MAKHIGIVACSAEGAALCYTTICTEAPSLMGEHNHPEVTMHTYPLASYMKYIRSGQWDKVAEMMASSAGKLASCGAQFVVCPDNTIHEAFDLAVECSPIPWLHIAREVAKEASRMGMRKVAVLGTKYLMRGAVYPRAMGVYGINCLIPGPPHVEEIDRIIFEELVNGVFREESRLFFNEVILALRERGCEGAVLGCTEIPLIVKPEDCPLPVLDSTRILARAAIREAVEGEE